MDSTGSGKVMKQGVRELIVDDSGWRALFWSEPDRRLLMKSYPDSGYHGGGAAHFEDVGNEGELAIDLRRSNWITRAPNDVVAFLVDRWCERRALGPLRRILEGWPNPGLTDGFGLLRDALDRVRSLERESLLPLEEELAHIAENAIQHALDRR